GPLLHRRTQRLAKPGMQKCRCMLPLALLADDGCLAIALDFRRGDAEGSHGPLTEQPTQLLPDRHQLFQGFAVAAGKGIAEHRGGDGVAGRRTARLAHLAASFLDGNNDLADLGFHRNPSSPLISEAFSPPARAWMRGPVVMTSATSISSSRGASG